MKKSLLLFFVLLGTLLTGQERSLMDDIKAHTDGIGLWWAGHNAWLIKSGDLLISTDILLDYDNRDIPPPMTAEELAEELDVSFITHGHRDHFNRSTTAVLVEQSDCIFVIPESCLHIAEELQIPRDRLRIAKPREPFEIRGVQL